ncbi:hypothetical protein C8R45DRAFT_1099787 [Mycena sanguinolenta]|nr:hypothetical protein C8R45DRAFT_1099787 [Mycena sanguinolenta]
MACVMASVLDAQWADGTCCPQKRKAHLLWFVGAVDALQHSTPAPLSLSPIFRTIRASEVNRAYGLSERVYSAIYSNFSVVTVGDDADNF